MTERELEMKTREYEGICSDMGVDPYGDDAPTDLLSEMLSDWIN